MRIKHIPIPFPNMRLERTRIKIAIAIIFLFTLLALDTYAIMQPSSAWSGGEGSLADKLIDASMGKVPPPQHQLTPQESRALQENKSLLWTPMPEMLSSGTTPAVTRAQSQGRSNESSAALMPHTTVAGSPFGTQNPTPPFANLAGTWSLRLDDTPPNQIVLTLFQVEDKVFGSGSMTNGANNNTLIVTASGGQIENQIYLDITSIGTISLYSLAMNFSAESVSGDYKAYMANGQTWVGKVQGNWTPIS
jgi:hypothetical protein